MVQDIIGVALIVLVYACLFIVVFAPTLYAVWFYLISRKVKIRRKGMLRIAVTVFCINSVVAYFLLHFAFTYLLTTNLAEKDALAAKTLRNALISEKSFHSTHGRYYAVGPIRGPYRDEHGLSVDEDVILLVEPRWDKANGTETLEAYALHVWGKGILVSTGDGKVQQAPQDSEYFARLRKKLLNSVK